MGLRSTHIARPAPDSRGRNASLAQQHARPKPTTDRWPHTTQKPAEVPTMTSTVIVAGARTPMGRFNGALASVSATDLGGIAIRGALAKSGVAASDVDYVIMGQVLQAGVGQIPARQAAVAGGIAMDVPAVTINKVCLSGLD